MRLQRPISAALVFQVIVRLLRPGAVRRAGGFRTGGQGVAMHILGGPQRGWVTRWYWVTAAVLVCSPLQVRAEPIITSAGLLTRLIFTDNLFLTAQGAEAAGILQLLPNITGGGASKRTSYRFYYGPSALFYGGGNSDLNRVFHVFQADANVDLIDDYFSLQFSANANQNLVNPGVQSTGFNALGNPSAFAQTASISVTPVIQFPLLRGDFASVRFSPGINYVFAAKTADGLGNTGTHRIPEFTHDHQR